MGRGHPEHFFQPRDVFRNLTTAVTLHLHGITEIETSRQAAEALRPLAGNFATLLYTLGVVAVGFLAIPTLAGSAAYAFAETFHWKQGLNEKLHSAKQFYFVVVISTALGISFDFIGFNPIEALFWWHCEWRSGSFSARGIFRSRFNKELMKVNRATRTGGSSD